MLATRDENHRRASRFTLSDGYVSGIGVDLIYGDVIADAQPLICW